MVNITELLGAVKPLVIKVLKGEIPEDLLAELVAYTPIEYIVSGYNDVKLLFEVVSVVSVVLGSLL
jgi:hypothetical protein